MCTPMDRTCSSARGLSVAHDAAGAGDGDGDGSKKRLPLYILAALIGGGGTWAAMDAQVLVDIMHLLANKPVVRNRPTRNSRSQHLRVGRCQRGSPCSTAPAWRSAEPWARPWRPPCTARHSSRSWRAQRARVGSAPVLILLLLQGNLPFVS